MCDKLKFDMRDGVVKYCRRRTHPTEIVESRHSFPSIDPETRKEIYVQLNVWPRVYAGRNNFYYLLVILLRIATFAYSPQ